VTAPAPVYLENAFMRRFFPALAVAAGLLAAAPRAQATPLLPNTSVSPTPTTLGTGTVRGSGTLTLMGGSINATVRYVVYQESAAANPLGGLTFLYQVNNLAGGDAISRFTNSSYAGFTTDANTTTSSSANTVLGANGGSATFFDTSGVQTIPSDATRSGPVAPFDRDVGFNFSANPSGPPNGTIPPGSSSLVLMIRTNAPNFGATGGFVGLADGGPFSVSGPQPLAAVPEPASVILFGGCFAGLGGLQFWRRRKAPTQN
jgi:hypothetical protein